MKAVSLLKKARINPDEAVLFIKYEEAMRNLLEAKEEYCPNLEIKNMTKKNLLTLLNSYADCVSKYHPENYHQERGVFLENFKMLKNMG